MRKSLIALLLAMLMCFSLLAGCSGDKEEATTESETNAEVSTETTEKTEEAAVNEITTATNTSFATLDPALISTTAMGNVYSNASANFFRAQADGTLALDLGDSYTFDDETLTYTFTLKEGLKWSDGEPLTAEHYVYAIKRAIGYGPDNAYAARNLVSFIVGASEAADAQMDVADMENVGVKAIDDRTFTVELNTVHPFFYKFFSGNTTSPVRPDFAVEHESAWSVNGTYPSCGPMVMESISPEEQAVFVKNDNYWNAEEVTLDKLTVLVMPDQSAQLNAFKAGQLDIAVNVPSETASNSQYANSLFKAEKYTSNYFILFNTGAKNTVPELKDVRVRKAMNMAIDKDTMLAVLSGGDYNVKLDGFIPYGFEGANGDFRAEKGYFPYDLDGAKKLMEEAGYSESNRLSFEYLYSNNQFHADVAQMLQQMWSQIYIDIELKSVEGGVFYDFVDNGEFTTCRYANSDSSDPLNFFKIFTSDAQIEGCQAINDATYDALVAEAYTLTDRAEYIAKLHEIEDYMVGEMAYVVPLLTQTPVVLVSENVEGFWTTVSGTTQYFNIVK
ncbi:MAG: peptide ABC transporter substrate-binding protein [Clostridia bacterium]|nr:peptide ABC transporter substrate-binding protein [Clostridia bacterium]